MEQDGWRGRGCHDDVAVHITANANAALTSGHTVVHCHTAASSILDDQRRTVAALLAPIHRGKLQSVQYKRSGVSGGRLLVVVFVLRLVAVGPIANRLHQYPIHLLILAGHIQSGALHLAANGFRLKAAQLFTEIEIIHQLFATEDTAETYS